MSDEFKVMSEPGWWREYTVMGDMTRAVVGVKASIQDKYITQPISQIRKKVN
jgi:hypothetical protein